MKKFIKRLAFFKGFCAIAGALFLIGYFTYHKLSLKDIPAPKISDSFSLNEKLEFIRKNRKATKIMGLGASTALNNLHSKTITDRFNSHSYINVSSWGMNMKDNYYVLKLLYDIHVPATIIMASNISEFQSVPVKKLNYAMAKDYLLASDRVANLYHLRCFSLSYYLEHLINAKKWRTHKNEYAYLGFDPYGGVNLDSTNFNIDPVRWNSSFEHGKIEHHNYQYLDSISEFCKANNIKIHFFHCPFREGLYTNLNHHQLTELNMHTKKVEEILTSDDHIFVNSTEVIWDDELFVDGEHFNEHGARAFTQYCFDKIKTD